MNVARHFARAALAWRRSSKACVIATTTRATTPEIDAVIIAAEEADTTAAYEVKVSRRPRATWSRLVSRTLLGKVELDDDSGSVQVPVIWSASVEGAKLLHLSRS